jgi:DNA-binding MarR family transcriptional regulator
MTTLSPAPKTTSPTPLALSPVPIVGTESTRHEVLLTLARAGDGGLSTAELAATAGRSPSAVRELVGRLIARGLVTRQGERGRLYLTPAGTAEAGARPAQRSTGPSAPALDAALALLPAEALRAFVRLLLSVTVARHHLHQVRPSGWLSAIATGPTGTAKTLAGIITCRLLGLDEAVTVRLVGSETERSLWGRREQVTGGGWTFRPAAPLGYPLLVLDELDKAPAELRTAVLKLLQGEAKVAVEDGVAEVVPAVLVTTNATASSLRAEYQRRAVVLDTGPLEPLVLPSIDLVAEKLMAPGTLPRLDLGKLRPPAESLGAAERDTLRSLLREVLTPDGWRLADVRGLSLAALGRAAVWGYDLDEAAMATAADYLACAWTMGEVVPERLADLRRALATGHPAAGAVTAGEAERAALEASRREVRIRQEQESLELVGARAAAAALCDDTARELGRRVPRAHPEHAVAAGLAQQLRHLGEKMAESRSRERLEDFRAEGEPLLERAYRLVAEVEQQRELATQQVELERAQRAAAKAEDRRWRALAIGRKPFDAFDRPAEYLMRFGLLSFVGEQEVVPDFGAGLLGLVGRKQARPVWRCVRRTYWCAVLGETIEGSELARWSSPAVKAIGAALLDDRTPALVAAFRPALPAAPSAWVQ